MNTKELVKTFDKELRHRSGNNITDFLKTYTKVLSPYAYSGGSDDEFGTLEKQITHVLGMMVYYREACKILGYEDDPRNLVWEHEEKAEEYDKVRLEFAKQVLDDFASMHPTEDSLLEAGTVVYGLQAYIKELEDRLK